MKKHSITTINQLIYWVGLLNNQFCFAEEVTMLEEYKARLASKLTLKIYTNKRNYFCLCVLLPPKLMGVQTSSSAPLITSQCGCRKGVRDVIIKDNIFDLRFMTKQNHFLFKQKPAPTNQLA